MGAWLIEGNGSFSVGFRIGKKLYKRSLKTGDRKDAEAVRGRIEANLLELERGRLTLPEGADPFVFLCSDGKAVARPQAPAQVLTLAQLFSRYFEALPDGAREANTLATERVHSRHLLRLLGEGLAVGQLTPETLQGYVTARSRESGRGEGTVQAKTLRMEVATLGGVWAWAVRMKLVQGQLPQQGLAYPKAREKAPFQTRAQLEAVIAKGGVASWEALYLTLPEVMETLALAQGRRPFVVPMLWAAAFTGMRRSELLRSRREDWDEAGRLVRVREKKKVKGRETFRVVPLASLLLERWHAWLAVHPGGPLAFGEGGDDQVSPQMADHHFAWAFEQCRWDVLTGWHVYRHSFISLCASRGIDQRFIDSWAGHTTDAMRRRYRHLYPDDQHKALALVFG
jgi:integrase